MTYNKNDIINIRVNKSRETFLEAEQLAKGGFWNGAANRLYYCAFYSVLAVLAKDNIKAYTHVGTKNEFYRLYFKTGILDLKYSSLYSELMNKRLEGDFNEFIHYEKDEIEPLFSSVKDFMMVIEQILK